MTVRYFRKLTFTDTIETGLYEFVQFRPGYAVIEAYDGTNRDTPSGGTGLADLPGTNGWNDGEGAGEITVNGSWIVVESMDSNNTNHFQVYIERESATEIHFKLIPLEDFTTGGAATSPPTLPATSVGAGSSMVTFTVAAGTNKWYSVADEGMFALLIDDGSASGMDWIYVGELDQARVGGSTVDDRCYVIWDTPGDGFDMGSGGANFNRLSPIDDTTVLDEGWTASIARGNNANWMWNETADNALGEEPLGPVGVLFVDAGHYHLAGFLRNVSIGGNWLAARGTVGGQDFAAFDDFVVGGEGHVVFAWDGATAIP
jgi:hypothetical protein